MLSRDHRRGINDSHFNPNAIRLCRGLGLGGPVVVLGHAKEQGPETGGRVRLGSNIGKRFVTGKREMSAGEGESVVAAVVG